MSHATCIVTWRGKDDPEAAISKQMEPFNENGEWFREGSRWDYWRIGGRSGGIMGQPIVLREQLKKPELIRFAQDEALKSWDEMQKHSPTIRAVIYGLRENETQQEWVSRAKRSFFPGYSFLKDGRWYENKRMGWFGCAATSECELIGRGKGKCIVGDVNKPPCIIGFNEAEDHWKAKFWSRFIEPLPDDAWLAAVDYHV